MEYVLITGMSGAGKTAALKMMEDMGYFCVDNLPVPLLERFFELSESGNGDYDRVALVMDIRNGEALTGLQDMISEFHKKQLNVKILFLDAEDETIIKRYKESRRVHPFSCQERLGAEIIREREFIGFLRERADYIIDTSHLLTRDLKAALEHIFLNDEGFGNLYITILSFGFKYGLPTDSDLVFDVRFLPNPYYVDELREKTGNDEAVFNYVMKSPQTNEFLDKLEDMLRFLIPNYIAEGKNRLIISIGCTGGKHRSVVLANSIFERLQMDRNYGINLNHRDIGKDKKK